MSNIVAFPLQRISATSFVEAVLHRAHQLRDERIAQEQVKTVPSSGAVSGSDGLGVGAATAVQTARPSPAFGRRRDNSEGGVA